MAIKEANIQNYMRPIEMLRKDFKEFIESDHTVAELVGYEEYNQQSVRMAAIKVMHENEDKVKFFARKRRFYLVKE